MPDFGVETALVHGPGRHFCSSEQGFFQLTASSGPGSCAVEIGGDSEVEIELAVEQSGAASYVLEFAYRTLPQEAGSCGADLLFATITAYCGSQGACSAGEDLVSSVAWSQKTLRFDVMADDADIRIRVVMNPAALGLFLLDDVRLARSVFMPPSPPPLKPPQCDEDGCVSGALCFLPECESCNVCNAPPPPWSPPGQPLPPQPTPPPSPPPLTSADFFLMVSSGDTLLANVSQSEVIIRHPEENMTRVNPTIGCIANENEDRDDSQSGKCEISFEIEDGEAGCSLIFGSDGNVGEIETDVRTFTFTPTHHTLLA